VDDACEHVRRQCAAVASSAQWVTIDVDAASYEFGTSGLDPDIHLLDGAPDEVARYVLVLEAINFGSGWFDELDVPEGLAFTNHATALLTAHARANGGPWTPAQLRALDAAQVADVLGQSPDHELMGLYAESLRQLGLWLGGRRALDAIESAAAGSAARLVSQLVAGMPAYADPGFLKRAQITANDLVLAGVVTFPDIDRLTVFADDLVPHVLRCDGVLRYAEPLARRLDTGELLDHGEPMEVEIRACAVHACEQLAERAGVPPRTLDNWLWHRGLTLPGGGRRQPRCRTTAY
jgi:hypothetical protein